MATLTKVGDLNAARILSARLQAEDINAVVRGEPTGPYPVTVGSMAVTEILVPASELEVARGVLQELVKESAAIEVESAGSGPSPRRSTSVVWWIVAVLLLVWIVWARISRYL
jgi:hypothetical protein